MRSGTTCFDLLAGMRRCSTPAFKSGGPRWKLKLSSEVMGCPMRTSLRAGGCLGKVMWRIYERHHTEVPCRLVLCRLFADAGAEPWLNFSMITHYDSLLFLFTISVGNRNVPQRACFVRDFRWKSECTVRDRLVRRVVVSGTGVSVLRIGRATVTAPIPPLSPHHAHNRAQEKVSVTPPARKKMLLFCSV